MTSTERRMSFISVSEDQVMGIIAANGVVGDFVIPLGQFEELGPASF